MASFRCYDNSDVIATLIITKFHLYLIQLWCQFFQIFVYGDVVYAQTWEVLTLKNYIEPPEDTQESFRLVRFKSLWLVQALNLTRRWAFALLLLQLRRWLDLLPWDMETSVYLDAHFSEPAYPQCRAIQQEVQNSWCVYKNPRVF